jgi:predicted DNA-binding transcriptional regulator AlpA
MTFLRKSEVAGRYGVSVVTVWRWTRTDHSFPRPIRTASGMPLWSAVELERWESQRRQARDAGTQ